MNQAADLFAFAEAEGRKLRDNGMALAAAAQDADDPTWMVDALAALKRVAEQQATVHVDNFLAEFPRRAPHYNANATLWRQAKRLGYIGHVEIGRRACVVDPLKRSHLSPVYASKIFNK